MSKYNQKLTSSSLKKYSISDRDFLNKKLHTSSRYTKVKSKTNSGFNATRRQEIEKEIRRYYKVKNNEVFQRISLGDLLQLMVVYAEENHLTSLGLEDLHKQQFEEDIQEGELEHSSEGTSLKYRDDISEVLHKMEDVKLPSTSTEESNDVAACPFLILDVRTGNDFNRGHLATSVCHPHSRLSRAVGWECPEMLAYKNHPEWIIVICDENETISPEVAATLIHRGYTNTFVLSGGLNLVRDKIGPPFITTDKGRALSTAVADFLAEKLSLVLIPPLRMDGAADWWAAKISSSQRSGSDDSGIEGMQRGRSLSRGRTPLEEKKKPWR